MAKYEIWLTDDAGKRLDVLEDLAFINYTRTVGRLGTLSFGIDYQRFMKHYKPFFIPDWRVEVWRSPAPGWPLRREDVYVLRKPNVYVREDGMQMLQFYGRNGLDLLYRRSVIQRPGTTATQKTATVDDMMKAIVREQMLYGSTLDVDGVASNTRAWPQNEFLVQPNVSLGPSLTRDFADKKVIDILKELRDYALQKYFESLSNRKIYFDVVPISLSGLTTAQNASLGWEFRTYADLYGTDRTASIEFSMQNENIKQPNYALNHLEEFNSVYVKGNGTGNTQIITSVDDTARISVSRWNRVEKIITASNESSTAALQNAGYSELYKGKPTEEFDVVLLDIPGGPTTPRSLYGLDWDLGDRVRVKYAGKQFDVEIAVVYVAMSAEGQETITARTDVQND